MYQKHYSRFLKALGENLHFAAHSHHAWPDVSREAHLQYWDDSARLWDDKWEHIFSNVVPSAQKKIAGILNLSDPKQIVFAPNTHELVVRLISAISAKLSKPRPIKILTTPNEFHSFRRQAERFAEAGIAELTRVKPTELAEKARSESFDLIFTSHVFFDSGTVLTNQQVSEIVKSASKETVICIDGYHAFTALPVDLSLLEGRIFYLGGGYKYAQAGEGACFMVVPKGDWKPINTGWFAEMDALSGAKPEAIRYSKTASAFWGSTQDPSGLYRLNAVWELFEKEGLSVNAIHEHIMKLQDLFLSQIQKTIFSKYRLMNPEKPRGHFLTFDLGSPTHCAEISAALKKNGVLTDYRGQKLRIGFGLYHTEENILKLISRCETRK